LILRAGVASGFGDILGFEGVLGFRLAVAFGLDFTIEFGQQDFSLCLGNYSSDLNKTKTIRCFQELV